MALPGSSESFRFAEGTWEATAAAEPRSVAYLGPDDRLGGVLAQSLNHRAAWSFLGRLVSSDRSSVLLNDSCHSGPFRQSQLEPSDAWLPHWASKPREEWKRTLLSHYAAEDLLVGPRIPGSYRYISSLGAAVRGALLGNHSAVDALAAVTAEWNEITAQYGLEQQIEANRASLGLEP